MSSSPPAGFVTAPVACAAATIPITEDHSSVYGRDFWLAYAANVALVSANAITFRFAEFIAFLGGSETRAGEIFGVGMLAALAGRFWLGQTLDRWGPRRVWVLGSLVFLAGATLLPVAGLTPPGWNQTLLIWLARILFQLGVAAMFSCSMVHIQDLAPPPRRTEVIGSLGTSGFVGQILGTQCGDWIFWGTTQGLPRYFGLFWGAAFLGLVHLVIVLILTRHESRQPAVRTPASHLLLWRYWPGSVALAAMAMGMNLAVTTVFLTRYATVLQLSGIGTFFLAFSVTAFTCRWLFRAWPSTLGRHSMIVWGLLGLSAGQFLLIFVDVNWKFIGPAALCGFGHALLFPAVVSLGSGKFPLQFRGTGTTLILGFMDAGMIIAGPLMGFVIDYGQQIFPGDTGRNGFFGMFALAGLIALVCSLAYQLTGGRQPDHDQVAAR